MFSFSEKVMKNEKREKFTIEHNGSRYLSTFTALEYKPAQQPGHYYLFKSRVYVGADNQKTIVPLGSVTPPPAAPLATAQPAAPVAARGSNGRKL